MPKRYPNWLAATLMELATLCPRKLPVPQGRSFRPRPNAGGLPKLKAVPPLHLFVPSTTQLGTRLIKCLLALVLATLSLGASAVGLVLQELPAGSLGQQSQVLIEAPGAPLSLPETLAKRAQFQPGTTVNLSFGIGAAGLDSPGNQQQRLDGARDAPRHGRALDRSD